MRIQIRKRKGTHRKPWQVIYRDGGGRRRSKQFVTEKDARNWSHRTGVDVMDGVHVADRAFSRAARRRSTLAGRR